VREVPGFGSIIQTTAPISPGSSGSPVVNMQGEVIGVASAQMQEGQNLNFVVPAKKIIELQGKKKALTVKEKGETKTAAGDVVSTALFFLRKGRLQTSPIFYSTVFKNKSRGCW
jgi:S1-C subfamily serine protease